MVVQAANIGPTLLLNSQRLLLNLRGGNRRYLVIPLTPEEALVLQLLKGLMLAHIGFGPMIKQLCCVLWLIGKSPLNL